MQPSLQTADPHTPARMPAVLFTLDPQLQDTDTLPIRPQPSFFPVQLSHRTAGPHTPARTPAVPFTLDPQLQDIGGSDVLDETDEPDVFDGRPVPATPQSIASVSSSKRIRPSASNPCFGHVQCSRGTKMFRELELVPQCTRS